MPVWSRQKTLEGQQLLTSMVVMTKAPSQGHELASEQDSKTPAVGAQLTAAPMIHLWQESAAGRMPGEQLCSCLRAHQAVQFEQAQC